MASPAAHGPAEIANQSLAFFRMATWALTSLFYLVAPLQRGLAWQKGIVIVLLLAAAVLTLRLVKRAQGDHRALVRLAMAEALGLPFLLLSTGGLASPFVWYALNPLLLAAVHLPVMHIWLVSTSFLFAASLATALSPLTRGATIAQHGEVALIIMLVTLGSAVFVRLTRAVEQQARRVDQQRQEIERAHRELADKEAGLSRLVRFQRNAIECEDSDRLHRALIDYLTLELGLAWAMTVCVAPSDSSVTGMEGVDPATSSLSTTSGGLPPALDFKSVWDQVATASSCGSRDRTQGSGWLAAPLARDADALLSVLILPDSLGPTAREVQVALDYASLLISRFVVAELAQRLHDRLVVAEEQTRIASEIHDSVSQDLFGLVYGLDGAIAQVPSTNRNLQATMIGLRDVAATVSRQIQSSIYQLRRAVGSGISLADVEKRLAGLGKLYDADVTFAVRGRAERVNQTLLPSLMRIAYEGVSNAVRHGHATLVHVSLTVSAVTELEITDNGSGFDPPSVDSRAAGATAGGMGLANIKRLAQAHSGSAVITSSPGAGCRLTIRLPDSQGR